jgi:DNA invertase Pin-like site-specific DNA recombinase
MLPLPNWITLERQREGIAKAKAEGKYKGRKPSARAKADQVRELGKPEWEPRKLASS